MKAAYSLASPRASAARGGNAERLLHLIQSAGSAGRGLRRWLADRLERFGLGETEFLVLWLCCQKPQHGGWVQGELAQAAGISPAQTSSLVERLRKRGLIDMKRSTMDRRRQVWHLLQEGEDLLGRIKTGLEKVAHRLDAMVSPEEQEAAARLFDRLVDATELSAARAPGTPTGSSHRVPGRPFEPAEAEEANEADGAKGGRP